MRGSRESKVAWYSTRWPTTFEWAQGCRLRDISGTTFLDFFAAAGSLNYGHNDPSLIDEMVEHLRSNAILCSLDMATRSRSEFLDALASKLLQPRGLEHRVQFTSPSGSAAVEAAVRAARKATGRRRVISLSGAFHGMTLDAISLSDRSPSEGRPTLDPAEYSVLPHETDIGTAAACEALADAMASGGPVAAVIVEVVQGEGGARPLSNAFLAEVARQCFAAGAVFVVDDVQAGCGRTGPFFSFEESGVTPDIVCLSKSLSAVGLPLGIVLIEPSLDVWSPGEHSGTFRGNNLAFVTATAALERWWSDDKLSEEVRRKGERLVDLVSALPDLGVIDSPCGRGLLLGLPCTDRSTADALSAAAFANGLLVETCGTKGNVLKLMPPLTVTDQELEEASAILGHTIREYASQGRDTDG